MKSEAGVCAAAFFMRAVTAAKVEVTVTSRRMERCGRGARRSRKARTRVDGGEDVGVGGEGDDEVERDGAERSGGEHDGQG